MALRRRAGRAICECEGTSRHGAVAGALRDLTHIVRAVCLAHPTFGLVARRRLQCVGPVRCTAHEHHFPPESVTSVRLRLVELVYQFGLTPVAVIRSSDASVLREEPSIATISGPLGSG